MVFNISKRFLLLKFKVKKFFKFCRFKKSKVTVTFTVNGNCKNKICGCTALFSTNENAKEEMYYVIISRVEYFKTFDDAVVFLKAIEGLLIYNIILGKVSGNYVSGAAVECFDYPEIKEILNKERNLKYYKRYEKPKPESKCIGTTDYVIETKPTNIVRTTGTRLILGSYSEPIKAEKGNIVRTTETKLILQPHSEPIKTEKGNEDWTIDLKPYNIPSYTKTTNWPGLYLFNPPHGGYLYCN